MKKILSLLTGGLIKDVGGVIDKLTTTDEERLAAKHKIQELLETKKWNYLHMPSKCIERDSVGNKYVNNRLISDQEYDKKCKGKIYFLPIYSFQIYFKNMKIII